MKIVLLFVALLCSITNTSFAAEERPQYALAFFNADWCGPCQTMKRTVWANERVKKVIADNEIQFFSVKDTDTNEIERYHITGFPTTVLLVADNGDWKEVKRFVGLPNQIQLNAMLKLLDGKK